MDSMRAADGFRSCFGKAEMLNFARLYQVLHCTSDVFNRYVRVDAMLIIQIDDIRPEPLQRAFDGFLDMLRPAVQSRQPFGASKIELATEVPSEFGGDYHLVA